VRALRHCPNVEQLSAGGKAARAEVFILDTPMYTLHMSWPFRALVLAVVLAWGLAPQLACFMPDQALTESEMDCCEGMASDCSSANMSHACCRTVVRTDVGIAAKVVRNLMPTFDVAERATDISIALPLRVIRELSIHNSHAPPSGALVSSVILRI
jgi:hypothetical protein